MLASENGIIEPIPRFALPKPWGDMQVPENIRKGVVFLGWRSADGKFSPRATGFIVSTLDEEHGGAFMHVVTAQHCVGRLYEPDDNGNQRDVRISVNRRDGEPPDLIRLDYKQWWFHPDDTKLTDVAVALLPLDERVHDFNHGTLSHVELSEQLIKDKEVGAGDEVFIVGLFRKHSGRQRNIPIVRIGNIAAMPEEPIWTKSGFMDAYLIEARSIGGLSGSPVLVNYGLWRTVQGQPKYQAGLPFGLLGLMHGHFDVEDLNSDIVVDDIAKASPEGIHSGIGVVVPVSKIRETLMQDDLEAARKKIIKEHLDKSSVIPDFDKDDDQPASDENPNHLEDFTRLVDVAARKQEKK
jgi:hypothetical protein